MPLHKESHHGWIITFGHHGGWLGAGENGDGLPWQGRPEQADALPPDDLPPGR